MKGKATLILIDPQTGEEVRRVEEENLATEALERLLDIPRCGMYSVMDMPTILRNYLPIWKNLLGGIILLGSNVDENKATVSLPDGFIPVGTAGTAYSGTDTKRGSLNENESGEIDGGYRLVWDFGTDKANGEIRCIALTSRIFGNNGFDADSERSANLYCQLRDISTGNYAGVLPVAETTGFFVGSFEPNKYISAKWETDRLVFYRHTMPDPDALLLTDTSRNTDPAPEIAGQTALPFIPYFPWRFFDPERKILYFFQRRISADGSHDTVSYVGVSVEDYGIAASGSYTCDVYGSAAMAVYGGKMYRYRESYIEVMDMSGRVLDTIPVTAGSNGYFYVYDGHLCYGYSIGSAPYHARVGCSGVNGSFGCDGIPLFSTDVKPPYTLFTMRNTANSSVYLLVNSGYIATINNLADPLVKTDKHALKIIYEITN